MRHNAVRGLYYKVLSSPNANGPYTDGGAAAQLALEASLAVTNSVSAAQAHQFFRVSGSIAP